jgi:tryptophan-rich sensory protein
MTRSPASKIILAALGTLVLGSLSGIATIDAITGWYATLQKPSFNPPNWIFGPVWTVLYLMMGVAAGLVWSSAADPAIKRSALRIYLLQLALNMAWSLLFFGLKAPLLALLEIIVLWLTILWCIRRFKAVKAAAAYLMVPYLLWVTFASVLNAAIVLLN